MTKLLEALTVTAELCGAEISEAAAKIMVRELSRFPEDVAVAALERTCREHQGRLTLAAVLSRIEDGRPGVDEAWAMLPKSEDDTAVLTAEMLHSMEPALSLYESGDKIGARMAFKNKYEEALKKARSSGEPIRWQVSLGYSRSGRLGPIAAAVEAGRISFDHGLLNLDGMDRIALENAYPQAALTCEASSTYSAQAKALISEVTKDLTE